MVREATCAVLLRSRFVASSLRRRRSTDRHSPALPVPRSLPPMPSLRIVVGLLVLVAGFCSAQTIPSSQRTFAVPPSSTIPLTQYPARAVSLSLSRCSRCVEGSLRLDQWAQLDQQQRLEQCVVVSVFVVWRHMRQQPGRPAVRPPSPRHTKPT